MLGRGRPTIDGDGRMLAMHGTAQDITQRKVAEEALREAFEREREAAGRLRALDEIKDSLLLAVSHELRTPLSIVLGLAETLQREEIRREPERWGELLVRLAANARRLERLLLDLLDLDRLNRGVIEPRRRPTAIGELIARIVETVEIHDHPLSVSTGEGMSLIDPAQVERIVENLLANANKHTPLGTPIWIRTCVEPEGTTLIVEDAGPGIPEPLREAIFEPFRQADTPAHAPGTGIGLSLVARFAQLHGGRAWVQPRPGGGSSFHVFLPHSSQETFAVSA
jgi:signal transduction histidine kinase